MPRSVTLIGILNVTPDSFSDGGEASTVTQALTKAETLIHAGAHWLDIGGESTRPGSSPVPVNEELRRVLPVVKALRERQPDVHLSIDTQKAEVALACLEAGAHCINDVSGLRNDGAAMIAVLQSFPEAHYVLMHSIGSPKTMQNLAPNAYPNGITQAVHAFFKTQLTLLEANGVQRSRILLDPGFGFGKTIEQNITLLNSLGQFHELGCRLFIGLSRKSFLTLGNTLSPGDREALTVSAQTLAYQQGARHFRVHDVPLHRPVFDWLEATSR